MDLTFMDALKIVDDAECKTLELYHHASASGAGAERYIEQLWAIQELKRKLVAAANAPAQAKTRK